MRQLVAAVGSGLAVAFVGCTSLLGDFNVGSTKDAGPGDALAATDANREADTRAGVDARADANADTSAAACGKDGTPCMGGACCGGVCASCSIVLHSSPTCTGTTCAATCDTKYTSCTTGGVTSCVDLMVNPKNCGACGHPCGAGVTCSRGFCDPVTVLTGSPLGTVVSIASDGTDVFWVNHLTTTKYDAVYQVGISGGSAILISATSPTGPATNVGFYGSTIAYTIDWGGEQMQFFSAAKGSAHSGAELFVFAYASPPLAMANEGATFYAASGPSPGYSISQALLSGTAGTPLFTATTGTPGSTMAAASNAVFWTDVTAGTVSFYNPMSFTSGNVSTGQTGAESLTTDGAYLYWIAGPAGSASLNSASAHPAAQTVTPVASVSAATFTNAQTVASDGTNIYWADTVGAGSGIYTVPAAGGTPVLRAMSVGGFPSHLTVGGSHLVWFEPGPPATLRAALLP